MQLRDNLTFIGKNTFALFFSEFIKYCKENEIDLEAKG